jgi:RNA polymerase sigma factor (sigma-70 family)
LQQIGRVVRERDMNQAMAGAVPPAARVDWSGTEAAYAASYRDLLRVAFVLTGSGAAAEDVVHDVFSRVGPRIATLDNPAAYLRVAVVNQCRSLHRRFTRAPGPSPAADVALDTGLTEFRDALLTLPARQRAAVVLRFLCDLPDDEIADILDCRVATVRSLVHRGLAALRTQIPLNS